ncbi:MAG: helix-turn-helix domain-containing protein [Proteobacteria bacterium]|nr:helix-turn-helix domain-containing protein [Pseudomonadota bacterium]MBU4599071.1 helix-turn-helix domain-containing protein [Pseudomonadota bacterium]MBV1714876.1 helix-turn-helix domain-containing protein [Desulfarculus sp.]
MSASSQVFAERFEALPLAAQEVVVKFIEVMGGAEVRVERKRAPVNLRETEAAAWLGVRPNTMARWRVEGKGPVFRRHGRVVVYAMDDLERWSQSQRRGSTSEGAQG